MTPEAITVMTPHFENLLSLIWPLKVHVEYHATYYVELRLRIYGTCRIVERCIYVHNA
jgi:hypothetical protein